MTWLPWTKKQPAPEPEGPPTVTVGGEQVEIRPLDLETACEVLILISPYLVLLEDYLPDIQKALDAPDRPRLLQVSFVRLRREMKDFPGDTTRFLALLLDKDPSWIAKKVEPAEVLEALGTIDRVNSLTEMYRLGKMLGLTEKVMSDN